MIFKMGRVDAEEHEASPEGLLPDAHEAGESMFSKLTRAGFTQEEIVALMGSHTIGFARMDRTGFEGRWTQNPHVFDNTYYKEVLLGDKSKFLKTPAEKHLFENAELRKFVEMFAQD
jgi:L-ascorbate peroxidase